METVNRALEGNVPARVPRARKQSVYMNKVVIEKQKAKALEKYVLTRSMNDYNEFVKFKNDVRSLTRTLRAVFEKKQP